MTDDMRKFSVRPNLTLVSFVYSKYIKSKS